MRAENISDFDQLAPKLRVSGASRKQGAIVRKIFIFKDVEPKDPRISMHYSPPPLDDETLVNDRGVNNTQAPKVFRPTHDTPLKPIPFLVISRTPIIPPLCLSNPT